MSFNEKDYQAAYREANREKNRLYARQYRMENPELVRTRRKIRYPKIKEKQLIYLDDWRKKNKAKSLALSKKHKHLKKQRTPKWLTKIHIIALEQFYKDAEHLTRYTGVTFEVDHMVPLNGKRVSGLHVPWNLQLLTETENLKKSNHFEGL